MPVPVILGLAAAAAAASGGVAGAYGAKKMKNASNVMTEVKKRHEGNIARYEAADKKVTESLDALGKQELEILAGFEQFSNLMEQIQNRPVFEPFQTDTLTLPAYNYGKLRDVSIGAGAILSGLSGAAVGTAGGIAASGATTFIVGAVGTASTGTALSTLSGVALTNATLAFLGGGSLAAGGGGIALGTAVLGAVSFGAGILAGGLIIGIVGNNLSDKAEEAEQQMERAEIRINEVCAYLAELTHLAGRYLDSLLSVKKQYDLAYSVLNP